MFVDYNGQIPLSQRLEINSKKNKAEITLLPISSKIYITVVPQEDVEIKNLKIKIYLKTI